MHNEVFKDVLKTLTGLNVTDYSMYLYFKGKYGRKRSIERQHLQVESLKAEDIIYLDDSNLMSLIDEKVNNAIKAHKITAQSNIEVTFSGFTIVDGCTNSDSNLMMNAPKFIYNINTKAIEHAK